MSMGLPLLPANKIQQGFNTIREHAQLLGEEENLERLFQYIDQYWLQQVGADIISVAGLESRTNNLVYSFIILQLNIVPL